MAPRLIPREDEDVSAAVAAILQAEGIALHLGAGDLKLAKRGNDIVASVDAGSRWEVAGSHLLIAVGRRPNTDDLGLDTAGVALDKRGFIEVDDKCRTTVPNVWAVGDVVRGPMLAHKGMEEGVMVAELIAGHVAEMNYRTIPSVIYTAPEIAWVGQTEEEVKASGRPYKVGTFSFAANGRAKGMQQTAGLVKLIADREHDDVLGVHIVGPVAGELIAEAVLAMEFSASAEDIQRTIHAHPTLSEALHEASLSADKRAIHGINR
jgi:dihydrolipoamide dehydrogenase